MTRSELVRRIGAKSRSLAHKDAEIAVDLILAEISDALAAGDRVEIRGFGSFRLAPIAARNARNPKTGELVRVAAKHVIRFKAGKELRERVDDG